MKPPVDYKNPSHYIKDNGIEVIDFIESVLTPDQFVGYLLGNILKYGGRFNDKDTPCMNSSKMEWYSDRLETFLAEKYDEKKNQSKSS